MVTIIQSSSRFIYSSINYIMQLSEFFSIELVIVQIIFIWNSK